MAMDPDTLRDELTANTTSFDLPTSSLEWARAFAKYCSESETLGGATIPGNFLLEGPGKPITVMAAALPFDNGASDSLDAATKIKAGVLAFHAALETSPALYYVGCTALNGPPFSFLQNVLKPIFDANQAGGLSVLDSMDAVAGAIHADNSPWTGTFPGPVNRFIT